MLASCPRPIEDLLFVYAHTGRKVDDGNLVYAVSAIRLARGKPLQTFSTLVRYAHFTARERYRSKLSKAVLKNAPCVAEAQERARRFCDGRRRAFAFGSGSDLEAVKRFCGLRRLVDLDFCAAFFLQQLESHSFKRLWEFLHGRPRVAAGFSADEIAELSVALVKHIAGTELNDKSNEYARAARFFLKQSDTLMGNMVLHLVENYHDYFQELFSPRSRPDSGDWYGFLKPAPRDVDPEGHDGPQRAVPARDIAQRFEYMSKAGKRFALRSSQVEYAGLVTDALNQSAVLCVEAGTGTGKTQGYLIPVLEFLWRNPGQRVAIATYTKSLQDQIFHRETNFTKGLFKMYTDIPVAYLKGKSSYVCVEKLGDQFDPKATGARLLAWLYLLLKAYKFPDADLDSVGDTVRPYLNAESFFTLLRSSVSARQGCTPKHRFCPAHLVTCQAKAARLVVTNHHKLALMERDPLLSGLFRNYVIDEANHFERAVRGTFRDEVNTIDLFENLRYLETRLAGITRRRKASLARKLDVGRERIQVLRGEIEMLRAALGAVNPGLKNWEERALNPGHAAFRDGDMRLHLKAIEKEARGIEQALKIVGDESVRRALKIVDRSGRKILARLALLREFADTVQLIAAGMDELNSVVSYLIFRRGFALYSAPVEVAEIIRHNIHAERDAVIYTAATLCHGESFDSFREIVGLDRPMPNEQETAAPGNITTSRLASPFARQAMRMVVHPQSISGRFGNKSVWRERLVSLLPRLVADNQGRTLVLFSSYDDLQYAAAKTYDAIAEAGFPLLAQRPGEPTIGLCDEFRSVKESVLFGVDTFWYGVDFPGDTLTQVIITRMPFPSPSDPILSARKNLVTAKAYWARYHYENEIKIKQGIGRLIRTHTDKGRVVFLDSRFERLLQRWDYL